LDKTLPTKLADKWTVTSVDSQMSRQVSFLAKRFVTEITNKWLFSSMTPFMLHQLS
jgi:hypothetical protein